MKIFRFLLFLSIAITLIITLNSKLGVSPPLGKFLSPWHGYLQNTVADDESEALTIENEKLAKPVAAYIDELGIPHIFAENDADLHFAQGYLTARDRLWQMDFLSRLVLGRISEVAGGRALELDRLNRRIGLKKMTYDTWEQAKKSNQILTNLNAYSDGVNAYIDELSYADYPIEFKLLDYAPEQWSPLKSCIAYAMLSNTLSRSVADLENTNALALFGSALSEIMFPDQLGNLDPVIPKGTKWDFEAIEAIGNVQNVISKTTKTIEKPSPLYGSNNFVVAADKTRNGNVIFANEPDLKLTHPSIWHSIHLNSDDKNVMGVTIPGTPLILIGFNDSIAWGVTNSPRDQVDWYQIEFKDEKRSEYWYNNQWFKSEKVIEEIRIKDEPSYFDTIIYVHHGPIVYDRNFFNDREKNNYAMRWIAHDPGTSFKAMDMINRANNYDEFENALKYFTGPPQNFLFGSSSGDIAINLPGKFPIKPEGAGKYLLDGSKTTQEWTNMIPFEHRLWAKNPKKGFLSSANQHPVDENYPYYTYDHHYEYYRGRRINDRLNSMSSIEPKDMMALQNDNYNYHASESLPNMLVNLDTTKFDDADWAYYNELNDWDYFNRADSKAATYFDLWWKVLYRSIWDEYDTVTISVNKPDRYVTNHLLINQPEFSFLDVLETNETENASILYKTSFERVADSLNTLSRNNGDDLVWYKYKNSVVSHLLNLKPFNTESLKIGGGRGIVNAAGKFAGPSWRMVVELDPNGTKAWAVYPGSQTGNPADPKYGHMIDKWAKGEYYQLEFGNNRPDSEKVVKTITFKP